MPKPVRIRPTCSPTPKPERSAAADRAHRHQPGRSRPRLLRRLRHHRRSRPQDGPPLDHGRAWRALPHAHHPAPEEGHRRRGPGRDHRSGRWKGGGGFRYFRLAPSLLEKDKWGNWVINKHTTPPCWPRRSASWRASPTRRARRVYWQHGHSTERDFIYVTTADAQPRAAPAAERRGRAGAVAAGAVHGLPGQARTASRT